MAETLSLVARTRAEKGLTLRDLSMLSGVSINAIGDLERRRRPNQHLKTIYRVAQALGLSFEDVLIDLAEGWKRDEEKAS